MIILDAIDTAASVISLLLSLFIATRVVRINQRVSGSDNVVAARDANVNR
jgi:hypothetical protein